MKNKPYTCSIFFLLCISINPLKVTSQNKYIVKINQPDPINAPVITTVSVSQENKNVIKWEQIPDENIQYFNIYQDASNPQDGWINVGKAMYPGNYSFSDLSSFPNSRSYQYKVSAIDKCGNEIFNTRIHKTINLHIIEINETFCLLKWNPYEGFEIREYRIFRGTDAANLILIDTTSISATNYIINGEIDKKSYYQVEAMGIQNPIKDEKKLNIISSITRSNIVFHQSILNSSDTTDAPKIMIYPNPLTIKAVAIFPYDSAQNYQLSILDLTGHMVYTKPVFTGEIEIERRNLKEGVYILQIAGRKILRKKLIIGRV